MTNDETDRAAAVAGASSPPQAADIRNRWWWVEHSVWTDRMLIRLEHSEPTTQWFRLWDKVLSERNLQAAFGTVWRNDDAPGVVVWSVAPVLIIRLAETSLTGKSHAEEPLVRFGGRGVARPAIPPLLNAARGPRCHAGWRQRLDCG